MVQITNDEEEQNKSKIHIFNTLFNFIKKNKLYINTSLITTICASFLYYYNSYSLDVMRLYQHIFIY